MEQPEIESQNKEVIASGSFVTIDKESKLSFKYKGEIFKFQFEFLKDSTSKDSRIDYSPNAEGNTLIMKFFNFDNPLGIATTSPIKIATSGNKDIYIHVYIFSLNDNIKNVNYTFYIDK